MLEQELAAIEARRREVYRIAFSEVDSTLADRVALMTAYIIEKDIPALCAALREAWRQRDEAELDNGDLKERQIQIEAAARWQTTLRLRADARTAELERENERLNAEIEAWTWEDGPSPEDDAIAASCPLKTGRHDLYREALRLVGTRQSKGSLVALVNWLLLRAEPDAEGDR